MVFYLYCVSFLRPAGRKNDTQANKNDRQAKARLMSLVEQFCPKGSRVSSLLHVLVLTDTVADADMLARELGHTGFELAFRRATTEAAYLSELKSPLDLILADNALREFDAMRAL